MTSIFTQHVCNDRVHDYCFRVYHLSLRCLTCIILILPFLSFRIHAQTFQLGEFEVSSISFDGNDELSTSELAAILQTKETPGFLNKFLYNSISERLGRKNEYLDPVILSEDVARLRQHYEDHGFHDAEIDTSLVFAVESKTVEVEFLINEGYRSLIDTVIYKGIELLPDFAQNEIDRSPAIEKTNPFVKSKVEDEVKRVLLILFNNGYANARFVRDSSFAMRYLSTKNYVVRLAFKLGKRYVFGDITINRELDSLRDDITNEIILDQLNYKHLGIYSQQELKTSERNLNRVGIFDLARIDVKIPPEEENTILVPTEITVRPKDKHELAPEISISDENNNFNLGTGIGYTNRNFLGGARTFSTRLRFRTQTLREFPDFFARNSNSVANVDLTFEMIQPYIFSNKVKGTWSFSFIIEKQKPYLQKIVRNKFGFTDQFAEFTMGFLDWTLEGVALQRNQTFQVDSSDLESLKQLRQLEEQEKRTQFNSIISFTIQRDKSNDIFSPSSGFIHSATFEESGLLPLLLKKAQPDLPFTQFYRVILTGRWYFDVTDSRFSIFGLKLKSGFEDKWGESRSDPVRAIPQTHRFYAGGGGSIRGWNSRDLSATGDPQFGGNVAFEGTMELRTNILQSLRDDFLDKLWTVLFIDFGNVWAEARNLQLQDLAIAGGFGIRYETFFGPFRIDYGFRVYDPAGDLSGRKWITQRKLFGQTFREGIIHFGIGHAF
ncbi:MAG: BamA/TamA family outer membrane protein [Ignavibacteriae bacterium]|nr:BamA/TamA family outer membrane protein [Ignavibacteriota bacterium]